MKIQDLINKSEISHPIDGRQKSSFLPTYKYSDKKDNNVAVILLDMNLMPFPWITMAYHFDLRNAKPRSLGNSWPPCLDYLKNALPKSPSVDMAGYEFLQRESICPVEEASYKFDLPSSIKRSLRKSEIIYFYSIWKESGETHRGFLWEYSYRSEILPLLVEVIGEKEIYSNMAVSLSAKRIIEREIPKEYLIDEDSALLAWSSLFRGTIHSSLFDAKGVDTLREIYTEAIQSLVLQSDEALPNTQEFEATPEEIFRIDSGESDPDEPFSLPKFGFDDFDPKDRV